MLVRVAPSPVSDDDQKKVAAAAAVRPWHRLARLLPPRPRTWREAILLAVSGLFCGFKLVATVMVLLLSYNQLVLYVSEPVLLDTVMAESPLPALTLCPRLPSAAVYNDSLAALRMGNISTSEFVRRLRPDPARLLRACSSCDVTAEHVTAVRVQHTFFSDDETRLPYCVTVQPRLEPTSETGFREYHMALELAGKPVPAGRWSYRLLVHTADREPTMPTCVYRAYERASSQVLLRPGTHVTLNLAMEGVEHVSRRGAPCGVTTQRQRRSCVHRVLSEAAGCRAVWMDTPELMALPLCPLGSQETLRKDAFRSDWQQRLAARCRGLASCHTSLVSLAEEPQVLTPPGLRLSGTVRLRVSWPSMMRVTRERLAVTGGDVASFIGGLVGLFSGLSVFSVLDAALASLRRHCSPQRHGPEDTQ